MERIEGQRKPPSTVEDACIRLSHYETLEPSHVWIVFIARERPAKNNRRGHLQREPGSDHAQRTGGDNERWLTGEPAPSDSVGRCFRGESEIARRSTQRDLDHDVSVCH